MDGLVLLSDSKDKYVDAEDTRAAVADKTSGRFEVIQYPKALHEIDNEIPSTAKKFRSDVISFLKKTD